MWIALCGLSEWIWWVLDLIERCVPLEYYGMEG